MADTPDRPDPLLLLEIALVLLLIGFGAVLYLRPASQGLFSPPWWRSVALGVLFFGVVGLHTWRRRRRSHTALHQVIREDAARHSNGG